jgi:pimeloyl-ACP methyl ester carboxylesterase
VLVVDRPCFGGSTGWPSQRNAQADAQAVHAYVAAREHRVRLTVIGRSLGTAIALGVASDAAAAHLVLLSPFESVRRVLRTRPLGFALAPWIGRRFDCTALAQACSGETLALLAEHDHTIPHGESLHLCTRLPRAPRINIVAGTTHRSLPRSAGAQAAIAEFLQRVVASKD